MFASAHSAIANGKCLQQDVDVAKKAPYVLPPMEAEC